MNELDCQKWVCDVVNARGGRAHKLSHRFVVGVSDLLVKLPNKPAALIEAKLQRIGKTTKSTFEFKMDVTPIQQSFMRGYYLAGMPCYVASFVERGKTGTWMQRLSLKLFSFSEAEDYGFYSTVGEHVDHLSDDDLFAILDATIRT